MKKFFVIFILLMFPLATFANLPARKLKNPPIGIFKKQRNGNIVQYGKNGKKIGTYKLINGKYEQVK